MPTYLGEVRAQKARVEETPEADSASYCISNWLLCRSPSATNFVYLQTFVTQCAPPLLKIFSSFRYFVPLTPCMTLGNTC